MKVFDAYASYYDLLYCDKDYSGEAAFVHQLIQKYSARSKCILELGCGTGIHAQEFLKLGYLVTGIDQSTFMLERAAERASTLPEQLSSRLSFQHGDIRNLQINRTFDAVISLFHVFSYLSRNEDITAALMTAKAHLNPDGILVFDCWYGPAVLTERPSIRVKRLENESVRVVRIAEPVIYPNENLVDINYDITVREEGCDTVLELHETHRMRYLFKPEVEELLNKTGFTLLECGEWLSGKEPGFNSWSVHFVARRI
jgi:SAM-dependent methyltransferase